MALANPSSDAAMRQHRISTSLPRVVGGGGAGDSDGLARSVSVGVNGGGGGAGAGKGVKSRNGLERGGAGSSPALYSGGCVERGRSDRHYQQQQQQEQKHNAHWHHIDGGAASAMSAAAAKSPEHARQHHDDHQGGGSPLLPQQLSVAAEAAERAEAKGHWDSDQHAISSSSTIMSCFTADPMRRFSSSSGGGKTPSSRRGSRMGRAWYFPVPDLSSTSSSSLMTTVIDATPTMEMTTLATGGAADDKGGKGRNGREASDGGGASSPSATSASTNPTLAPSTSPSAAAAASRKGSTGSYLLDVVISESPRNGIGSGTSSSSFASVPNGGSATGGKGDNGAGGRRTIRQGGGDTGQTGNGSASRAPPSVWTLPTSFLGTNGMPDYRVENASHDDDDSEDDDDNDENDNNIGDGGEYGQNGGAVARRVRRRRRGRGRGRSRSVWAGFDLRLSEWTYGRRRQCILAIAAVSVLLAIGFVIISKNNRIEMKEHTDVGVMGIDRNPEEGEGGKQMRIFVPPPPSNLEELCSSDLVKDPAKRIGCEELCEPSVCCHLPLWDANGCLVSNLESCAAYKGPCGRLRPNDAASDGGVEGSGYLIGEYGDVDDGMGGVIRSFPPALDEIDDICSSASVATLDGYVRCRDVCDGPADCCEGDDGNERPCRPDDPVLCDGYAPCASLLYASEPHPPTTTISDAGSSSGGTEGETSGSNEATDANRDGTLVLSIPPAPADIGDVCSATSVATAEGYAKCRDACDGPADCCEGDDGHGNLCRPDDQSLCDGYAPCASLLFASEPPPPPTATISDTNTTSSPSPPPGSSSGGTEGETSGSTEATDANRDGGDDGTLVLSIPPAPADIGDVCSATSVATAEGYARCHNACDGPADCCEGDDGNGNLCRPDDPSLCDGYTPCAALLSASEPPPSPGSSSSGDMGGGGSDSTEAYTGASVEGGVEAEGGGGGGSGSGGNDDHTRDGGGRVVVLPPPPPDLSERCTKESISSGPAGFERCEDACDAATCCLEPDRACIVTNPDECGNYLPCVNLYEVMAEVLREDYVVGGAWEQRQGEGGGASEVGKESMPIGASTTTTTNASAEASGEAGTPEEQIPPPPFDIGSTCDAANIEHVSDFMACEDACEPAYCCWTTDDARRCREDNVERCGEYEACDILERGYKNIVEEENTP